MRESERDRQISLGIPLCVKYFSKQAAAGVERTDKLVDGRYVDLQMPPLDERFKCLVI